MKHPMLSIGDTAAPRDQYDGLDSDAPTVKARRLQDGTWQYQFNLPKGGISALSSEIDHSEFSPATWNTFWFDEDEVERI